MPDPDSKRRDLLAEIQAFKTDHRIARALFENFPDYLYLLDPSGWVLEVNEKAARGVGHTRNEVLGTEVFSHMPEDVARRRREVLREVVAGGKPRVFEEQRPGMWFMTSIVPIGNEDGEVDLVAIMAHETTARRLTETQLYLEKSLLETYLDASSDTFFVFEPESGRPVRWNRTFREISGYSDEEIAGLNTLVDLFEPAHYPTIEAAARTLEKEGIARIELPLLTKGGQTIPYEYVVTHVETVEDETPLACSVGRDITERRRIEANLKESEARHRGFLDSLGSGVVAHGPDTTALYWNNRSLQILGLTEDQMTGRTAFDPSWKFLAEDGEDLDVARFPVNLTISENRDLDGYVVGVKQPESEDPVWAICNSHRVFGPDGELDHVLVSFFDITELKRGEEERSELEAQVKHAQKLESLGVLAGGIAHDFNNLLMAILGNTELALADLEPGSELEAKLAAVEAAARRASDLSRKMLAYSGRGQFEMARMDLNDLATEMVNLLRSAVPKKVELVTELADDLPLLEADAGQAQQVVMNLITNAAEAIGESSEGRVTVRTGLRHCTREFLAGSYLDEKQAAGDYLLFEVEDTGSGMDQLTLDSLFDPFYTTKFTGRGLGLAAVLGIVRGHGGAIMIDSELGVGSTFRVLFPVSQGAVAEPPSPGKEPRPASWRGSGKVLVVDDEESVRELAVVFLERMGFTALEAVDGRDAVEQFETHQADLVCVLLDFTMPRMDGAEACQAIRSIRPDVPVIMTSGFDEAETLDRLRHLEKTAFLKKPYPLGELRRALQGLLPGS